MILTKVCPVRNKTLSTRKKQNTKKNMKRNLQVIFTATAASVLTFSVLGQDRLDPKSDRTELTQERLGHRRGDRLNSAAKASDVLGLTVKNYQDEKLGKVEDLAVDVESGRIVQVIISSGGLAGVGDRLTAVPPGALHHDVANKVLHLDASQEKLKSAPEFKAAKWAECCDLDHVSSVYAYYGQEPAFKFIHKGEAEKAPNTVSTRNADGTWSKDRMMGESQWMIPAARLRQVQKASQLMGTTVKNRQDEKLGKVDNLLVDVQSGRIVAVVVSSGGFLGMGDELSAVPPTALRFNAERDTLQLDTTKEMMSAAPHFQASQWPDFNQPMYSDSVYRAYRQEPYFTTNALTGADNTARNVRDRNDRTLTPLDQGNSQSDIDTTAQIRKSIMAANDMSVNAKNVKIITNHGRVTLRGPVNSAEEKRRIGEVANGVARSENVDNQLEVTIKNTGN